MRGCIRCPARRRLWARRAARSALSSTAAGRRILARTEAKERQAEAGRKGGGETRAALYGEATKRGIPGRSRMTKAQLARALGR